MTISIFGPMLSLIPLGLFRWFLKKIGLKIIADWKVLDNLMISLIISGFASLLVIKPLYSFLEKEENTGIRMILLWIILFLSIFVFYSKYKELTSGFLPNLNQRISQLKKKH